MAAIWLSPLSPARAPEFTRAPIPARVLLLSADTPQARHWRALLLIRRFTVTAGYPDPTGSALALNGRFDVIVLDLTDAFDTGLALCRRLRTAGPLVPVLMVHPQGGQAELLDAFEAGTDAYMCGAIEDGELLGQIGTLFRKRGVTARGSASAHTSETPTRERKTAVPARTNLASR